MKHFNLLIEMYDKQITKEMLAEELNLSKQAFMEKIEGHLAFSEDEKHHILTLFPNATYALLFGDVM